MITIEISSKNNIINGFTTSGHADYDEAGKDIVCAAISALEINMVNSLEQLTHTDYNCDMDEEAGTFAFSVKGPVNDDAKLLINSCILGFTNIYREYGDDYLTIIYKEV